MFRFGEPKFVVLLILSIILTLYVIRSFYKYRARIFSVFSEDIILRITKNYNINRVFRYIIISLVALILISIGIMSPQFGSRVVDIKKKGIDIIIALDVSRSMLSRDILPSRLERAKLELGNLISQLKGDRIGVILFAGQAFMQVPLTTDYDAARLFLKNVGVDSVPVQGTNFKSALSLARDMFVNSQQTSGARVILILSDGEDHEGNYDQVIEELRNNGIKVYAIGLGTLTGEPVPDNTEDGRTYKRDRSGQVVVSRLNEGVLKKITSSTGGVYIQGSNNELGIPVILEELKGLKKGEISSKEVYNYLDRYWIIALISAVLLIYAYFVLPFTGKKRDTGALLVIFTMLVLTGFSPFLRENPNVREGNELYQEGKFKESLKKYDEAGKSLNREPLIHYNKASALIKDKRYNEAYEELKKSLIGADDKLKSKIYYNMGNLFLEQQKYNEAIDSYIKSIQYNREFLDPKHNLEMVLRMMKEQEKQNQQNKNKDNKEEEKKEDNKEEAKDQDRKDREKTEQEKNRMDISQAEQLLDSLKEKETEQPFSKFLLKDFSSANVEKDW
jgi:Ca-activated chloride channel family protein